MHQIQARTRRLAAIAIVFAMTMVTAPGAAQAAGTVREWDHPQNTPLYPGNEIPSPMPITTGGDGNIWFARLFPNHGQYLTEVGRITPKGTYLRPYTTGTDIIGGLTLGPDKNVWFVEKFSADTGGASVGRITPAGKVTRFPTCGALSCGSQSNITTGPDGNLWFPSVATVSEGSFATIDRITPSGVLTRFRLPEGTATDITAGPDGNVWFTLLGGAGAQLGRITPNGTITEYSLGLCGALNLATGPDGLLWITDLSCGRLAAFTPDPVQPQQVALFGGLSDISATLDITAGPGGVYFTIPVLSSGAIGRATTAGVTFFDVSPGSFVQQITLGPDNNIWFGLNVPNPATGRLLTGA